jgi:hypothetical protein
MATTRDVWGGAWGDPSAWGLAWTITEGAEPEETFSGGYPTKNERAKIYRKQMEGLANMPILSRHYPVKDKVVSEEEVISVSDEISDEDLKAIMMLIH